MNYLKNFYFKYLNKEKFILSKYSGILFNISGNINEDCLKEIKWTKSTIDIADTILISLVSYIILIKKRNFTNYF